MVGLPDDGRQQQLGMLATQPAFTYVIAHPLKSARGLPETAEP
jgi:hypothetical protein